MSNTLDQAAYNLAEEIRYGEWNHVADLMKKKPAAAEWTKIIDELKRRCPGYTLEEYQRAIGKGLQESR